jgi:signal transduction histidine kinase
VSRRILAAIVSVAVLAVGLFGLPLAVGLRRLYRKEAIVGLEREAARAALQVPASFPTSNDPVELPEAEEGTHLALYDHRGARVVGRGPVHADPVVLQALRGRVSDGHLRGSLVVALPVASEEVVFGVVRASVSEAVVYGRVYRAWAAMAGLAAVVLAAATLVARAQAGRLGQPVQALRAATERLGNGDFSARAPSSGVAEVDAAAAALNATAERLGQLVARERAFTADASHQLRTPLTGLRLRLEAALATPEADRSAALEGALEDVDRLETTVEDLLALARDVAPVRQRLDLAGLLGEVERHWRGPLAAVGRPLRVLWEPGLPQAHASAAAVRQVLDVLVGNAAEHGAGAVSVKARAAPDALAVDVGDEGPGPSRPSEELFRRRSDPARGRGIGLALARSLTEAEGGRLVLSRPGPAPCFTLLLPAWDGETS